ncbi:hypothetical protein [Nocardia sp. 348MFTsu5.1]|uniref:hypothetical protein n=1 Tax=Nocardia sp. 348MFTsu5.1 TaxID=1172185 RepID=UPI0003AA37F0|nr:hypothetical protein [Nocardia sp. 348MFTsu5.1]
MKSTVIPKIALGVAVVALIAVIVAMFIPRSADGTAVAPPSILAQKQLTAVALEFANQRGATYSGTVTSGSDKINLDGVEVTASGDLRGTIKIGGESADIIGVNRQTYAMGSAGFWKAQLENPKMNYEAVAGGWAALDPATFPDLGLLLAPPALGLALGNDNSSLDMAAKGPATGLIGTPDERFTPAALPDIVEEDDGTLVAGGTLRSTVVDGTDTLATVVGPLDQPGGAVIDVDLTVESLEPGEIAGIYDAIDEQAATLAHIPAPYLNPNFDESGFRLSVAPAPCSPPVCEYIVTYVATTPGTSAPGSITIVGDMTLTLNDRPVGGTCTHTVVIPLNGRGDTRCAFNVPNEDGTLKGDVSYVFTAYLDQDPGVLTRALAANEHVSTAEPTGVWTPAGFKGSAGSRDYNLQVTGINSTYTYVVGGQTFDGRAADGTLLAAFGPGYSENIGSDGSLSSSWDGTDIMIAAAKAQTGAAGNSPVRWVFAESDAAAATVKTLEDAGVSGVEVVTVPAV